MIRSARLAIPCLATLATGCALSPNNSYVAPLQQPADAEILATGLAEFVALRLPAASSTVALDPTPPDQPDSALTPALAAGLRRHGFAVADGGQQVAGSVHHLRYLVTPLDNGDLVRLTLDDAIEGPRFFARNTAGGLQPGGPYTVTQAETAQ
jgi:type IV secretion system protein TrbH